MKITYWSDYACPYCYIGETRLKNVIKDMPEFKDEEVEFEMKAFQLDPYAAVHATSDTQTRFAKKYGISMEEAGDTIEHISQLGRDEGIDFRYATTLFTNTMDAHRLTKFAMEKGNKEMTDKLTERLYAAYFTDNKELADKDLLLCIAVDCGFDAAEVEAVLDSDKYHDEVVLDEREAARYGIHAVPCFIIGDYALQGAQPAEIMKSALLKAMEKESSKVDESQGMACGPDGCRIG